MKTAVENKWSNIPFKSRILISMFLVAAFPILLISLFSYHVTIEEMRDRMDSMAFSKAREVQGQIEKVLENIRDSYIETLVSEPITTIMSKNIDYSDYSTQVAAINQLKGPTHLRSYISGFTFVNFETDWVLSNRGMYHFSEADNQEEILELVRRDETQTAYIINNLSRNEESIDRTIINTQGFYMAFELPVPSHMPKCLVTVNISEKALCELAENYDGYGVTLLDAENNLIFSTEQQVHNKQGKLRTNQLTSPINGFTYVITYENKILQQAGNKIANLAFVLIIALLLGAGITCLISMNIYRPVSQLVDKISGLIMQERQNDKDDFQYIEEGVTNLAQSIDLMKETITNQKDMLEEILMSRLLSGTINHNEITSHLEKLGQGCFPYYSMMALSFVGEEQWNQEPDKNILMAAIREFIMKETRQSIFLVPVVWERMIVFLLGDESSIGISEKVSEIKVKLEELLHQKEILSLHLGVSREFYSLKDAFKALHEAVEAAKGIGEVEDGLNHETKYSAITMYGDLVEHADHSYAYPIDRESEIKELVDLCKKSEACTAVHTFIDDIYIKKIPAEERRYYLQRLLLSILEVASDAGIGIMEIKNLDNQEVFLAVQQLYDIQKMKEYLSDNVVNPIIDQLIVFRSKDSQSIEEKVYALIKKSRGDITLAECAEKLNYHPNYIGRVLRCENNTSFSAYVAARKLEYARELLVETELSITDIAKQLNYTNTQNFIRFFNKQEHMTPGQYRKSFGIKNRGERE